MNRTHFLIGSLLVALMFALIAWGITSQEKMKSELRSGCVKTDLRVYVGGRVGEVLTIYDCSAPK